VFIIGNLRGTPRPEVFPLTRANTKTLKELTKGQSQGFRVYDIDGVSTTLASQAGGLGAKTGLYAVTVSRKKGLGKEIDIAHTLNSSDWRGLNRNQEQNAIVQAVLTPDRVKKRQNGRRFKEDGEPSFTLTGQDIHGVYNGVQIRRLTPIECERLQGFPDDWTKYGVDYSKGFHIWRDNIHELIPISDTQRYKMMGNAVTTNVVKTIIERL
jgi:DNA (cytosine-5)-methyltransferase 1